MSQRNGFALLAVLWVVVALGGITAGAVASARAGGSSSTDRILLARARWAAEGCQAVAIARLTQQQQTREAFIVSGDTLRMANGTLCAADAFDPGTRLLDDSTSLPLRLRLDSVLIARGDTSRLSRVSLLTSYGSGRVNVNAAPEIVLLALPGMSEPAVRLLLTERAWGRQVSDLSALAYRLPPAERQRLMTHWPELTGRIAFQPSAVVVTARGWIEGALPAATIQILAVPAGHRIAIVRRRVW